MSVFNNFEMPPSLDCRLPPLVFPPNPPVFAVLPKPPLPPKPPDVAVFPPNRLPPVVVVDEPKAGLGAPKPALFVLFAAPKPEKPPEVAVLPPKSEPPVEAGFAAKPPPVLELPKPPKVLLVLLLLFPNPKDMMAE